MANTTIEQVKGLISTTESDPVVQNFIDSAESVVNGIKGALGGDQALWDRIELNLSAHYVAMRNPDEVSTVSDEMSGLKTTRASRTGKTSQLTSTAFGVIANQLSNGLIEQSQRPKAFISPL